MERTEMALDDKTNLAEKRAWPVRYIPMRDAFVWTTMTLRPAKDGYSR
jgi:hypothetical protein